jgi:outer membrane protein
VNGRAESGITFGHHSPNMKKIIIIILTCLGGFFVPAQAQDSIGQQLPKQWTLQDAINYALKNNISVNTLRLSAQSSQQDLLQSKASLFPSVTGSVSQSMVNSKDADPVVGGFATQASFSGNYGISSSVTLYNGGYLKNNIKSKELSVQIANLNVQETQNDISLSIAQAYLNILLAQESRVSLDAVLNTSQEQLKQGQIKYNAGSIARKDLVQIESQVASDAYNLVNADNTVRLNTLSLKQLLQLPATYVMTVATPDTVTVSQTAPALSNALEDAISTRPEIKNKDLSIQLAQVELEKVKAGAKPTVSLNAGLATGYSNNQDYHYFTQMNNNFYQSLGVTVSIPIYSRRTNKTNIEKSKISIEQARLSLLDTKTTLSQQVEQAYINWQNAKAQYSAAEIQLNASKESYDITNEQLRLGAMNIVEWQQQKSSYVQALQSYVQSKYTALLYNKVYEFYAGKGISIGNGQ